MRRRWLGLAVGVLAVAGLTILILVEAYLWAVLFAGLALIAPLLVGVRGGGPARSDAVPGKGHEA